MTGLSTGHNDQYHKNLNKEFEMFLIHSLLAITNGQNYVSNHISGSYANGTRYHLRKLEFGTRLVIETPVLVEDTSDEGVLKAIEEGKLNIFPLTMFQGYDAVAGLKKRMVEKIEYYKKLAAFDAGVAELNTRYPQVTKELCEMVRYHDWYYRYTDDIRVYRAGKAREDKIKEALKELNAEGYYTEYSSLIHNR
jgi:hypothetical protein